MSPATVSKVFNSYSGVSQRTRDKVLREAKELGYTPNNQARTLATKKSWSISLLFSEDLGSGIAHAHFGRILQSFVSRVQNLGYDVVFVNNRLGHSYLDHCRYRGVDGALIAAGPHFTEEIQCVLDSDYTCVSVEEIYPDTYTVICDNYMGAMQALEHLYFLGHRKIAHLAGPGRNIAGKERYKAYLEFHEKKGLPVNPKYVAEADKFVHEAGLLAATELMQRCWDDPPTAIFAAYDELAVALRTVLLERGFRIPGDISLIGFDDLPMAEYLGITTIHQDRVAIGTRAADLLVRLIGGEPVDEQLVTRIPTALVVRDSCARIGE